MFPPKLHGYYQISLLVKERISRHLFDRNYTCSRQISGKTKTRRIIIMELRKYLMAGGLASVLVLGACSGGGSSEEESSEESTEEGSSTEEESSEE